MKFTNISFVLVAVLSISCKKVYEVNPNLEPKPAKLSVFNACTDCGTVSFYLGPKKFLDKDIDFMTELGYQDSPTNKMELSFSTKGSTTAIAKKEITLSEQGNYTAFVAGTKATPSIMVYSDDLSKPSPKFAHIRFANFMVENKGLNLYLQGQNTPLFSQTGFAGVQTFEAIMPGSNYTFLVKDASNDSLLFQLEKVSIATGKIYTLVAKGSLKGTGNQNASLALVTNK